LILLSVSETYKSRLSGMISVYGRVPLFYFIIHLFIIHATMFLVLFIQGFGLEDFVFGAFKNGRPETGGGTGLTLIYIIWIVLVLFLYPVCKWFGEYKAAQPEKRLLRFL
jgi:hypothetical protein